MRKQEIITVDEKDFLVIALPTIKEFFEYGFVSASGKSFVYRKRESDSVPYSPYLHVKINPAIVKG